MFNDIIAVREYLMDRNVSVFGLNAINNLLDKLDHPERDTRFVHVTGTNGKGSTSSYLISILIEAGYRVGSFSSPAVFEDNEIIKYQGECITDSDFLAVFNIVYSAISEMEQEGMRMPTKFEIETAMAFEYFKRKNVDIAVVEVGMGGELDSTNVLEDTLVEMITRISYDHMGILGNTLKEIATNKAGIIKKDSTVITTMQDSEAMKVIERKAASIGAKVTIAGDGVRLSSENLTQTIGYKGREYVTSLMGYYQIYNMPIAIEAARELKRRGFGAISDESIRRGIEKTELAGRFQVIGKEPYFILDGAHNDEASAMLKESIVRNFKGKKLIYILGIFKDKEYKKILDNTLSLADEVITFDWDNVRHMSGQALGDEISKRMDNVRYVASPYDAVKMALDDADTDDVIVAFGSLSHLKDIRNGYKGVKDGRY